MMTKEIPQGELIYTGDKKLLNLYLIMRGTASASYPGGEFTLRSGDVIGLCDADFDTAYNEVLNAVRSGEIEESTIDKAVNRVMEWKEKNLK